MCVKQLLTKLLEVVSVTLSSDGSGRALSTNFEKLPSREMYPDYYILIKRPIALANMRAKLSAQQ